MIDPVLKQEDTPDHGAAFWADVDQALQSEALVATTESPAVGVLPAPRTRSRAVWPLVAAATVLALAGLSVLFFRGDMDPATTDVVSGPEESGVIPLDGPSDDDGDPADVTAASVPPIPTVIPSADTQPAGDGGGAGVGVDGAAPNPGPQNFDDVPTYELAAGNTSTQVYVPTEPFSEGARFLGTFDEARLSWFSVVDPTTGCTDPAYAEIRSVSDAGFDTAFADPNPRFSGNISQFTPGFDVAKIAWLAECAGQLEFFVADAGTIAGQAADIRLAWTGEGSSTAALMVWDGNEVTLNSIGPEGEPFFVSVDTSTGDVTGSGVRVDVGDGSGRSSWIVGATPSANLTWWNANQTTEPRSCDGQTIYLHSDVTGWQPALVDPVDVAAVTSFALNPDLSQVAFTDDCGGINTAQVFLGTVRADGLISSVRTIDMSLWATGNVSLLQWEDPLTLRIHIDDSNTGGSTKRFNYVFDDGRDNGVIVQLN